MDQNTRAVIQKRLERTAKALNKNRFDAHVLPAKEALPDKLRELMPAGSTCSAGGSMTLLEAGVIDFLREGGYTFHDRDAEGADAGRVYHDALSCRFYLMSSNAVTEDGKLYNVDGRGNRVAALAYGPERVIVIAGYNKIVPGIEAARERMRSTAAPANAIRIGVGTPCEKTGKCEDCRSPGRICCSELVSHFQKVPGRVTVLLVPEELGY